MGTQDTGTNAAADCWMFDYLDHPMPTDGELTPPQNPPRAMYDLPIFGAFWRADGADRNA